MTKAPENSVDTKTKIMDVAEKLFAEKGIDAISMRAIISEAQVNLAAIHYHFGSKDDLIKAVIHRFVDPVNKQRLRLLDELEGGNAKLEIEPILRAFLSPVIGLASEYPERIKRTMRLVGQLHSDPERFQRIVGDIFSEVVRRFSAALAQALPELPENELMWRFRFMLGSMFTIVTNSSIVNKVRQADGSQEEMETLVNYLAGFVAAGFRASVTKINKE